MKTVQKLAMITGLILGTSAFAGGSLEQAYIASCQGRTDIPVPVAVAAPQLDPVYAGRVLQVKLTVDEAGAPRDIQVLHTKDYRLVSAVTAAMAQWRFAPAQRDGQPVAMKVEVPLHIVSAAEAMVLASN